jgi:hypothetical protein
MRRFLGSSFQFDIHVLKWSIIQFQRHTPQRFRPPSRAVLGSILNLHTLWELSDRTFICPSPADNALDGQEPNRHQCLIYANNNASPGHSNS